jgi:hypothetical protein
MKLIRWIGVGAYYSFGGSLLLGIYKVSFGRQMSPNYYHISLVEWLVVSIASLWMLETARKKWRQYSLDRKHRNFQWVKKD